MLEINAIATYLQLTNNIIVVISFIPGTTPHQIIAAQTIDRVIIANEQVMIVIIMLQHFVQTTHVQQPTSDFIFGPSQQFCANAVVRRGEYLRNIYKQFGDCVKRIVKKIIAPDPKLQLGQWCGSTVGRYITGHR